MPWRAGISRNSEWYEVYVDGERQPTAFEADISKGWARCYILDDAGNVKVDSLGQPWTRLLNGRVEIRKVNK